MKSRSKIISIYISWELFRIFKRINTKLSSEYCSRLKSKFEKQLLTWTKTRIRIFNDKFLFVIVTTDRVLRNKPNKKCEKKPTGRNTESIFTDTKEIKTSFTVR